MQSLREHASVAISRKQCEMEGPRRYLLKRGVLRATETIVHMIPSIRSGAAADKIQKYTFGSKQSCDYFGSVGPAT
jgi:hypothetical protein